VRKKKPFCGLARTQGQVFVGFSKKKEMRWRIWVMGGYERGGNELREGNALFKLGKKSCNNEGVIVT